MLGSFRGSRAFDAHIGNNRRNFAALRQFLLRLGAGQSSFDDFHRSSRSVVFWPEGNDGATSVKNVSNELESCGAHQAVGIDAQGNVVNGLAAVNSFRDHELLVFGPFESGGQMARARLTSRHSGGGGSLQEALNQGVESG